MKRKLLLDIYSAGLTAVNGSRCVTDYLNQHPINKSIYVIAIGKAAVAMSQAAIDHPQVDIIDGLVITKQGYAETLAIPVVEAAHPIPDQSSLDAGNALLTFIANTPADADILFLLSGGASALVEVLKPSVSLEDLQQLNQRLLANSASIHEINQQRRQLSAIKYGGLKNYLAGRKVTQFIISDVTDDDAAIIGSGLLYPDDDKINSTMIANNHKALKAMANCAKQHGYQAYVQQAPLDGDAEQTATKLLTDFPNKDPGIYIYGGETTVQLPEYPGQGGRNQHFALAAALACQQQPIICLAAATDGSDGPTDDAGAIIDGQTITRGELEGLDAKQCLVNADAGTFLHASGDLISTGPTGTNVMDVVLIYSE